MEIANEEFKENLEKIFDEFSTSFHHAFLLETKNREFVFDYFKEKIDETSNKNENLIINLKVFDIEKAREVIEYGKTSFGDGHFVIISFYSITREAQNALLKFLEEAGENIKIILIIHAGANIINTIISRLYRLELIGEKFLNTNSENEFLEVAADRFLNSNPLSRMKLKEITEILSKKDEYALEFDDKERADRESLEKLLLYIYNRLYKNYEAFLEEESKKEKDVMNEEDRRVSMGDYQNREYLSILEDVAECMRYAKNNSSSGKTLLEYLSLRLPEIG